MRAEIVFRLSQACISNVGFLVDILQKESVALWMFSCDDALSSITDGDDLSWTSGEIKMKYFSTHTYKINVTL